MANWTRRQFGLWSSAALLVGHRAFAAEPEPQQAVPPSQEPGDAKAPKGFDALSVKAGLTSNGKEQIRYELSVTNDGTKGQTFHYELTGATLVDGSGAERKLIADMPSDTLLAYLEQRHPFARRMITPSFVDVAPGKTVALEALLVDLHQDERPKGQELRIDVGLYKGLGDLQRTVSLVLPWPTAPNA